MLALMYLIFFLMIILAMIFMAKWVWHKTKNKTYGFRIGMVLLVVIAISMTFFWNYLPVKFEYVAMCNADAGFTQYVSPQGWRLERQSELSKLGAIDIDSYKSIGKTKDGFFRDIEFGGLLESQMKIDNYSRFSTSFKRTELRTVDAKSLIVLARYVNYSAGNRDDARFWLTYQSCFEDEDVNSPTSRYFGYRSYLRRSVK